VNEPREELADIVASVRALVEWYDATGATGLPHDVVAPRVEAPRAAAPAPPRAVMPQAPAPSAMVSPPAAPRAPIAPPAPPPERAPPQRLVIPEARAAVAALANPSPVASSPDERRTRLALLAEEARTCSRCRLVEQRKQAVFSRGNPFAELCFVGEGPGADEDDQGEPFVGKAGQLLDKMIVAMGYAPADVYICNVVKCRPPENRKPERDEMEACIHFLHDQLAQVQPKVIVALGATAVQGMLGAADGITRMRGKWKLYRGATPVMPTFHPAYLLRQPAAKREVWSDLQEVMRFLGKGPKTAG
jgi:uracil-DNA glycosylase family 4